MIEHVFKHLAIAILLACTAAGAQAGSTAITSPANRVALLELYTSEGCSSCPPADRWVSSLKDQPGLWRSFIPVSFHVDYWDYIGWPDRFASPDYSERQHRHAAQQSMRTVYTPGFFLNGAEWRWRGRELVSDIEDMPAGVLRVDKADQGVEVRFDSDLVRDDLRISVALLGFGIRTRVKAGENAGRTLEHDFVVLSVEEAHLERDGGGYRAALPPPASDVAAERYALAAWVSSEGDPAPIQAAGGWWR